MPERGTTIPEYKARMKEGQKQIYYVSGASKAAASSSPVLDRLKSQGFEVYTYTHTHIYIYIYIYIGIYTYIYIGAPGGRLTRRIIFFCYSSAT